MNFLKQIHSFFSVRIYTNLYTLIFVGTFIFLIYKVLNKPEIDRVNQVLNHLDSIEAKNEILFSKIDSLDLKKANQLKQLDETKSHYDSFKNIIDSLSAVDALERLLSESRQLQD